MSVRRQWRGMGAVAIAGAALVLNALYGGGDWSTGPWWETIAVCLVVVAPGLEVAVRSSHVLLSLLPAVAGILAGSAASLLWVPDMADRLPGVVALFGLWGAQQGFHALRRLEIDGAVRPPRVRPGRLRGVLAMSGTAVLAVAGVLELLLEPLRGILAVSLPAVVCSWGVAGVVLPWMVSRAPEHPPGAGVTSPVGSGGAAGRCRGRRKVLLVGGVLLGLSVGGLIAVGLAPRVTPPGPVAAAVSHSGDHRGGHVASDVGSSIRSGPWRVGLPALAAAILVLVAVLYAFYGRMDLALVVALPATLPPLIALGWLELRGEGPARWAPVLFVLWTAIDLALASLNAGLDRFWRGRLEAEGSETLHLEGTAALSCLAILTAAGEPDGQAWAVAGLLGVASSLALSGVLTQSLSRWLFGRTARHIASGPETSPESPRFWGELLGLYRYRGPYVESYLSWKLRLDPIYRGIDALVPVDGPVLDVGCGYGLMTHILARGRHRRQVVGIDFDARKIAVARETAGPNGPLRFECQDAFAWPFPAARSLVLIDVLHYWDEDRQRALIDKACACLPARGAVIVFRDACASEARRHWLTALLERFSTGFGFNRKGQGLKFRPLEFYLEAFAARGFQLVSSHPRLARGSNRVCVFRRGEVEADGGRRRVRGDLEKYPYRAQPGSRFRSGLRS